MESPEMLISRATSWPGLPGACEKDHARDIPGGPLPGQGTRLGKQGLTCPGATPSTLHWSWMDRCLHCAHWITGGLKQGLVSRGVQMQVQGA